MIPPDTDRMSFREVLVSNMNTLQAIFEKTRQQAGSGEVILRFHSFKPKGSKIKLGQIIKNTIERHDR